MFDVLEMVETEIKVGRALAARAPRSSGGLGTNAQNSQSWEVRPDPSYSMYCGWLVMLKSSNMWVRNSKVGRLKGSLFQHSSMIL